MKLNKEELYMVRGGFSGSLLTSIIIGVSQIYELGRSLGGSIRRLVNRKLC